MKFAKNNEISTFMKKRRKELGLTQQEFSIRTGLGLNTVRDIEQGKLTGRLSTYIKALSMLGCKLIIVEDKPDVKIG